MQTSSQDIEDDSIRYAKLTGTRQFVVLWPEGEMFLQFGSSIDRMYDQMNDRMLELSDGALDQTWAAYRAENPELFADEDDT